MSLPSVTFRRQKTLAEHVNNAVNFNWLDEIISPSGNLGDDFSIATVQIYLSRADDDEDFSQAISYFLSVVPVSVWFNEAVCLSDNVQSVRLGTHLGHSHCRVYGILFRGLRIRS